MATNLLFIAAPSGLALIYYIWENDRRGRTRRGVPIRFVIGMMMVLPALSLTWAVATIGQFIGLRGHLWHTLVAGVAVEEIAKVIAWTMLFRLRFRPVDSKDRLHSAATVAMGFAFLENCWYLASSTRVALLRGTVVVVVHAASTMIATLGIDPMRGMASPSRRLMRASGSLAGAILLHASYNLLVFAV